MPWFIIFVFFFTSFDVLVIDSKQILVKKHRTFLILFFSEWWTKKSSQKSKKYQFPSNFFIQFCIFIEFYSPAKNSSHQSSILNLTKICWVSDKYLYDVNFFWQDLFPILFLSVVYFLAWPLLIFLLFLLWAWTYRRCNKYARYN